MAKYNELAHWYDRTWGALLLALIALGAAYLIGSRSLDTGSWQQYFLTLGLVIVAGNRLVRAFQHRHREVR